MPTRDRPDDDRLAGARSGAVRGGARGVGGYSGLRDPAHARAPCAELSPVPLRLDADDRYGFHAPGVRSGHRRPGAAWTQDGRRLRGGGGVSSPGGRRGGHTTSGNGSTAWRRSMPLRQDRIVLAAHVVAESAWIFALAGIVGTMAGFDSSPLSWYGVAGILRTVGIAEPSHAAKGRERRDTVCPHGSSGLGRHVRVGCAALGAGTDSPGVAHRLAHQRCPRRLYVTRRIRRDPGTAPLVEGYPRRIQRVSHGRPLVHLPRGDAGARGRAALRPEH